MMNFLEKDLEQIIFETNTDYLFNRGLHVSGLKLRQLRLGNYGIADLVTISRPYYHTHLKQTCKGKITVFELKKEAVTVSAFLQAVRYFKGIESWMFKFKPQMVGQFDYEIVLVGSKCEGDLLYLPDIFCHDLCDREIDSNTLTEVNIYTYKYDFNGISFKQIHDYSLVNEGI